ncbi:MAG: protein kinase domain-containing protein [Geminicoccaceae bacterium]
MTSEVRQSRMRDQVFISYSHKDEAWLDQFLVHLKAAQQANGVTTWSDRAIEPGQNWEVEINDAIERACVAILLVSADFLASDFIRNKELPKILKAKEQGSFFLYWVPLKHAPYKGSVLESLQAFGNPERPLEALGDAERNRFISDIAVDIGQKLGQSVRIAGDARQRLIERVAQLLRDRRVEILEEIGCGDTSMVFRARQGLREYAVKAVVGGDISASERAHLRALVDKVTALKESAYIKVQDALLDDEPICIVCEYIPNSMTLSHVLHQHGGLPPHDVVSHVRQLARALGEAHEHGLTYRKLLPSNLFFEKPVFEGSRVRLSPVVFLSEANTAGRVHGIFYTTRETLNYITPEYYYGMPANEATDQYALGLIALSMLQGGPPVSIRRLSDLTELPRFFENAREFFDGAWRDQAPGLSRVIARMLCQDPEKRWPSMEAVVAALEPLQRSQRSQGVHVDEAKRSYCRYCRGKPAFYRAFYEALFRRAPRTKELFKNVPMSRQYQMIDEAMEKLLNFRDGSEPTTLSRTRDAHRRFQLAPADFDRFGDAFLETLEAMGEQDPEVLDSWRGVLRPGIDYMKQVCAQEPSPGRCGRACGRRQRPAQPRRRNPSRVPP